MIGITNEQIHKDYELIAEMRKRYWEAIWEGQCGQSAHYDNQQKLVRIAMADVRCGLTVAEQALMMLDDVKVEED